VKYPTIRCNSFITQGLNEVQTIGLTLLTTTDKKTGEMPGLLILPYAKAVKRFETARRLPFSSPGGGSVQRKKETQQAPAFIN
jgi:hypothetical protein